MNTKLTIKELPEAVAAFAAADFDHNRMRSLMDLIQAQTPYMQKRFWKLSDAAYVAKFGA
jgi:hypothetical protein